MNVPPTEERLDVPINAKILSDRVVFAHRNKSSPPLLGAEGKQMRKLTVGLIVLIAVSVLASSLVAAHDTGTGDNASDMDSTEQAEWMEEHMTERMGEERAESMRERMGMSYEEMGAMMNNGHMNGTMDGMGSGMGCHS